MLILAGRFSNSLALARSVVATSEDANFPVSNLGTGEPWEPFIFGSAVTDGTITADISTVLDGGFESGVDGSAIDSAANTPWVISVGTPTYSTDQAFAGTRSALLNSAGEEFYQDIDAVAGKQYRIEGAIWGDGTNAVELRLQNRSTGRWLTSGGLWQSSPTAWATRTVASFANQTLSFTVEDIGHGNVKLRYFARKVAGTDPGYVDEMVLHPFVNFISIHGHNINDIIATELRYSTDNFSASDNLRATLTKRRGRFYGSVAETVARYWRLKFVGTNTEAISIGEWVLGEALATLSGGPAPRIPYNLDHQMPQVVAETSGRVTHRTNLSTEDLYRITLDFEHVTGNYEQLRDRLLRAANWSEPVVIVPDPARYEVIHGRPPSVAQVTRQFLTRYEYQLVFDEDPFEMPVPVP